MKLFIPSLLLFVFLIGNVYADNTSTEMLQPGTARVPNTVQCPQDVKMSCTEALSLSERQGQILTIVQNQLGWIGTAFTLVGLFIASIGIVIGIVPFLQLREVKQEIREIHDEHEEKMHEYEEKMRNAISEQSSRHEKRLYCVEDVIAEMWTQRSDKMDEEMATVTDKQQVTEIFSRTLNAHSKDGMTLRKLLLDDSREVYSALGDLESRADELPKAQMVE